MALFDVNIEQWRNWVELDKAINVSISSSVLPLEGQRFLVCGGWDYVGDCNCRLYTDKTTYELDFTGKVTQRPEYECGQKLLWSSL